MAKAAGLSVGSVQRIWRAHGLQPHRTRQFKLSTTRASSTNYATSSDSMLIRPHAIVLSVGKPDSGAGSHTAGTAVEEGSRRDRQYARL